ncbi:MAG: hypothetical protein IJX80_02650 [Clostridia bacterium]|nr:hypothetical protein [Clostridia bacterium]
MRRNCYGRRRRWRTGTLILLILLATVFLVSCVAGTNVFWVKGLFGWDVDDYAAETTERVLQADSEVADELCDMVEMLVTDSVHLESFRTTSQAVKLYRDAILNDMLRSNYAHYTGNGRLIAEAQGAYPHTVLSTVIPTSDFENTVYRYFGGTSVDHQNGDAFAYLNRADAYTSVVQARACGVDVVIASVEETENTYRMRFALSDGEETSEEYTAIFVKREDGSCYWKALQI